MARSTRSFKGTRPIKSLRPQAFGNHIPLQPYDVIPKMRSRKYGKNSICDVATFAVYIVSCLALSIANASTATLKPLPWPRSRCRPTAVGSSQSLLRCPGVPIFLKFLRSRGSISPSPLVAAPPSPATPSFSRSEIQFPTALDLEHHPPVILLLAFRVGTSASVYKFARCTLLSCCRRRKWLAILAKMRLTYQDDPTIAYHRAWDLAVPRQQQEDMANPVLLAGKDPPPPVALDHALKAADPAEVFSLGCR